MCGIVGYVGNEPAVPIIMDGLKALEYRGYDSAGIALVRENGFSCVRSEGKLGNLTRKLLEKPLEGNIGIGHTRWATHGAPSERNAHPHIVDGIAVVHNGIIENYLNLRAELTARGRVFSSDTDTEVIPHLISSFVEEGHDPETAIKKTLQKLEGSLAICVLFSSQPQTLYAARISSPLVVGVGEGRNFVASDVPAIMMHTRNVIFLEDGDVARLTGEGVSIFDVAGNSIERKPTVITWSPAQAEKGGYSHYMLKEIYEQPKAIADTIAGKLHPSACRIDLDSGERAEEIASSIKALHIVACGTSYHSALAGRYWIEKFAGLPVTVDIASEYRYREPLLNADTGLLVISQSGETADTLAAMEEGKRRGAPVFGICNVLGSSLARGVDAVLYTHAGPEIGVASTKAFTTQLVTLFILSLFFAKSRGRMADAELAGHMENLLRLPKAVESVLKLEPEIKKVARMVTGAKSALYLGRGAHFPIALEGALKLKEISYIHAEGYAAGEMKHGPIALVDENLPVIALLPRDRHYEKMVSNVQEIKARNGRIIAFATEGDEAVRSVSDMVLHLPDFDHMLMPIVSTIPMQQLAYHVAVLKGADVDQPRNLAKSVTVE